MEDIANKRILHYQPSVEIESGPLWAEIHGAVTAIEEVCSRYYFLLLQIDRRRGLLPGNWSEFEQDFEEFWN